MNFYNITYETGDIVMAKNAHQNRARKNKDDEFYTRIEDVAEELSNYKKHFKNKTVFCNCDDPEWSAFWIFFHQNFADYGLKKLIATHFNKDGQPSYVMEYEGGNDVDVKDWHQRQLKQNGDFESKECVDLLKHADIIVTNPPWSLFRKYVALLIKENKKFVIIGNKNAVGDKDIFPYFKENKIWLGYNIPKNFSRPDGSTTTKINGLGRWFTNLDIQKRHKPLIPELKYEYKNHKDWYPKYENYDAINIGYVGEPATILNEKGKEVDKEKATTKVDHIPYDYFGLMGVPITFMDKFNPDEFEIVQLCASHGKEVKHIENECGFVNGQWVYSRILIKRREQNENNKDRN